MEQAAEESIYQLSAATKQDVHPVQSWQQMVATFYPQFQLDEDAEVNTEQLISDPQAQHHIGLNIDPLISDAQAEGDLSITAHGSLSLQFKAGLQVGLSGRKNHQISRMVDLVLGQSRSETSCRLRFLAVFNLVFHVIVGVPYLFGDLHGVHATYLVMLIMTVLAIAVAVISLLVSYWPASDPGSNGRSNWNTGLLIANLTMLGGRRAVYWVLTQETGN